MSIEKLTKDEYNYIIFDALVRALAAMEEMFQKCTVDEDELVRYNNIKQQIRNITYKILEMKEK